MSYVKVLRQAGISRVVLPISGGVDVARVKSEKLAWCRGLIYGRSWSIELIIYETPHVKLKPFTQV